MRLLCSAGFTLALFLAPPAFAQDRAAAGSDDDVHTGDPIVVTAPYVRSLDILGNVSVLEGDELARDIRGQIGDTLTRQPGVSATSFSPRLTAIWAVRLRTVQVSAHFSMVGWATRV